MLVYGKNVLKDLDKKKIKKVYCARKDYQDYLEENKIHYEMVDNKRLDKMVHGLHQGIVIDMYDFQYSSIDDLEGNFVVILDHIEDPHNFGSIIRTCACAGIKSIIIPKDRCVKVTDTVMKVSEGTLDKVKIIMVTNLCNTINYLKKNNYFVYVSDMDGKNYKNISYADKKALVISNEGNGVSNIIKNNADEVISIPLENNVNSLNASVAAGILIYGMKE